MLMSPFKEIEALRCTKLTNRPRSCEKVVIVDGLVVIRLKGRKWWCNWSNLTRYAYFPSSWNGQVPRLLKALVMLGIIDQEIVDKHLAIALEHDDKADKRTDNDTIRRIIERQGKPWFEQMRRRGFRSAKRRGQV